MKKDRNANYHIIILMKEVSEIVSNGMDQLLFFRSGEALKK